MFDQDCHSNKNPPVTAADGISSTEELIIVVAGIEDDMESIVADFDRFLIVVCKSILSCCKARLNLSSLSSFISNCRFSFSKSLYLNIENKNSRRK